MKQKSKKIIQIFPRFLLFLTAIFVVAGLKNTPHDHPSPTQPPIHASDSTAQQPDQHQPNTTISTASTTAQRPVADTPTNRHEQIIQSAPHEYTYRIFATPNDPRYSTNWTLSKVNAPAAWDIATGNGQTVVAVIDSGFALAHEDLASQWAQNSGETGMTQSGGRCWTGTPTAKQSNGCDDDNNGYIDDWRGWNFVIGDNNPQTGRTNTAGDGVRHGTQVAGIAGASSNNGVGMAAVNWNTKIMPLQALDDDGIGYTSDVTAAVYYAVDNGATVINLSLGAYDNDPTLRTAVSYAATHNVPVIAAAGNCGDGANPECAGIPVGTVAYPAAYPDVIAVGASTQSDQRAVFSSYGQSLDVSAPGYGIPSSTSWSAANPTALYSGALYGTSFASPQVASLAALIKSMRPASSINDITALLNATATKVGDMNGLFYTPALGHGIINAGSAINIAALLNSASPTPTLLQAGSYRSEHEALAGISIGSGCQASGGACTIQMINSAGYKRFLPYTAIVSGNTGWTWASDALDAGGWEIRARSGETVSTTPYFLSKKSS
jgi:subtilisin family serine protease